MTKIAWIEGVCSFEKGHQVLQLAKTEWNFLQVLTVDDTTGEESRPPGFRFNAHAWITDGRLMGRVAADELIRLKDPEEPFYLSARCRPAFREKGLEVWALVVTKWKPTNRAEPARIVRK
jgi:hypothetical protein